MREVEFLPQWYVKARRRRDVVLLYGWVVIALASVLVWSVLKYHDDVPLALTRFLRPAVASASGPNAATTTPAMETVDPLAPAVVTPLLRSAANVSESPGLGVSEVGMSASKSASQPEKSVNLYIQDQKPPLAGTDEKSVRALGMQRLYQQAAQLRLQSTMTRPTPKAMVNGQLVEVGGMIEGFRIVQISAGGITVDRDGVQLEIAFK